jgi:two-component sensor histidine kinase
VIAQPHSLVSDQGLLTETSRSVVRTMEWTVLCYQIAILIFTTTFDYYSPVSKIIISLLIPCHIALLPAFVKGRGPFSRGGVWVPVGIAASFALNGLVFLLSPPNTYGNPWIPVQGYSGGTFVMIAFYPWLEGRIGRRFRWLIELLLVIGFLAFVLTLTALNNDGISSMQLRGVYSAMVWPAVGYLFGKSLGQLSIASVSRQLEIQRRDFNEFFDFLHSDVKAGIAAVRADLATMDDRASERLKELDAAVSDYRVQLALAMDQVPVAALVSERIRTFGSALNVAETPRVGALTVPRPLGIVIGRALGDLLTNIVVHGAGKAWIQFRYNAQHLVLSIRDDGPGFPAAMLDNESTSLFRLRQAAHDLGGDLVKVDQDDGVTMELILPMPKAQ